MVVVKKLIRSCLIGVLVLPAGVGGGVATRAALAEDNPNPMTNPARSAGEETGRPVGSSRNSGSTGRDAEDTKESAADRRGSPPGEGTAAGGADPKEKSGAADEVEEKDTGASDSPRAPVR